MRLLHLARARISRRALHASAQARAQVSAAAGDGAVAVQSSTLYSPYKSDKALSPSGPLYVDWSPEDEPLDPQLAGLRYPRFPGPLWRYSRHLRKSGDAWQDRHQKRNFGEVMHPDDQALWVYGPEVHADVTAREIVISQLAFFGFVGAVMLGVYATFSPSPLAAKELPHGGLAAELGSLGGHSRAAAPGDGAYAYASGDDDEDAGE